MSTIIYVPGMCGAPYQFRHMAKKAEEAGHESMFFQYEGHQRGHLAEGFSAIVVEDYVSQLVVMIDAIPAGKKIVIVGHSLGGVIAAMAASARPDRVVKIILIGIPMTGYPMSPEAEAALGSLMPDIEAGNPIFLSQELIRALFFSGVWHLSIPQMADQATPPSVLAGIASGVLQLPPKSVKVYVISADKDATDPVENNIRYGRDQKVVTINIPEASHCGVLEHEDMVELVPLLAA